MPLLQSVTVTPSYRFRTALSAIIGKKSGAVEIDIVQARNFIKAATMFLDAATRAEVAKVDAQLAVLQNAGARSVVFVLYPVDAKPLSLTQIMSLPV